MIFKISSSNTFKKRLAFPSLHFFTTVVMSTGPGAQGCKACLRSRDTPPGTKAWASRGSQWTVSSSPNARMRHAPLQTAAGFPVMRRRDPTACQAT